MDESAGSRNVCTFPDPAFFFFFAIAADPALLWSWKGPVVEAPSPEDVGIGNRRLFSLDAIAFKDRQNCSIAQRQALHNRIECSTFAPWVLYTACDMPLRYPSTSSPSTKCAAGQRMATFCWLFWFYQLYDTFSNSEMFKKIWPLLRVDY